MVIINADGQCYMPGALSELIFANTTASLTDSKLTLAPPSTGGCGTVNLTAGPEITVSGLEISNAQTLPTGNGLSVSKNDNTHSAHMRLYGGRQYLRSGYKF